MHNSNLGLYIYAIYTVRMDAFTTHEQVISDYRKYLESFIKIKDKRIANYVKDSTLVNDVLPEPLVQFNPAFKQDVSLKQLIDQGILQPEIQQMVGSYNLYKHQVDAITIGAKGAGFIVTSGTGSGKSLTFLTTIFNDILKQGPNKKKGVKAILVYPMNALINSQYEEIQKYAENYGQDFPISFAKYSGPQSLSERAETREEEPDIILTNYMMLELIMTRQSEKWVRDSIKENLKYLVYDELHTYRGRQGSDVSILNRRIQSLAKNELIFIGTSATMASEGTPEEKKKRVAEVASTIFGYEYTADKVINESLEPCTNGRHITPSELKSAIEAGIDKEKGEEEFKNHALANWLEMNVSLKDNAGTLERGIPLSLNQVSEKIREQTGLFVDQIKAVLIDLLKWAEKINSENREKGIRKVYLPYRFHQFISQTGSVSVTLDSRANRVISSKEEPYIKVEGKDRQLYPLLFSRFSGYDFIKVELDLEENILLPGNLAEDFKNPTQQELKDDKKKPSQEDFKFGYIVLDEGEEFWEEDFLEMTPESWWNTNRNKLKPYNSYVVPRLIYFDHNGNFSFEEHPTLPLRGYYMPAPLRIDPTASVFYDDSRTNENTKLARLGSEGRSTATSILTFSIIKSLVEQGEPEMFQKLLSFTDNRQDASLQAGHFNDFYTTIRFRAALNKILTERKEPLEIHELPQLLYETLDLKESDFAFNPSEDPEFPDENNIKAVKQLLLYRAILDLKRGWRYTMPNLEQVGLLKIEYRNLKKLAGKTDRFAHIEMLSDLEENLRYEILESILDYFRTNYANEHRFFKDRANVEALIEDRLDKTKIWSLGEGEKIESPRSMHIRPVKKGTPSFYPTSVGARSSLGKYLQRVREINGFDKLRVEDYENWFQDILDVLVKTKFLIEEKHKRFENRTFYKLNLDNLLWVKYDADALPPDNIRVNYRKALLELQTNDFFKEIYRIDFSVFSKELVAREHTGQIKNEDRIEREEDFRAGKISTLFCSPTMELGIDISNLNIVHMRNAPPNPANYAQRSGRAGRGGQTALVFTYCANRSPHDVHYFKNSAEMVAGSVEPPKIDLVNEELITGHLNAFLLMKMGLTELKVSAKDILDLKDEKNIVVREEVMDTINQSIKNFKSEYLKEFNRIISDVIPDPDEVPWFTKEWVSQKIDAFPHGFVKAFDRWIRMFQNATYLRIEAQKILDNHTYKAGSKEKREATRQEYFARKQLDNLKNEGETGKGSSNSEFYVFRYLAAEGFLPGYNFTRLPVRVVLGHSYKGNVDVLSRPRKLALTEYGPYNIIYHSGNKFRINRMMVNDMENRLERLAASSETGYAFFNEEINTANIDPLTGNPLDGGDKLERYGRLLELSECEANPVERISSIEEERSRAGYEVKTYFNYTSGVENAKSVVLKRGDEKLLQLYYNNATGLFYVNKKAKRNKSDGFKINQANGFWLSDAQAEKEEIREDVREVYLYTKDTADTLYIQPMENIGADREQLVSLSYALKRGIEKLFKVEESEIGVELLGDREKPNIMIYEAAEGSLGILSQLIANEDGKMKKWFIEAYRNLHFDPDTFEETERSKELPKATYEDLLSYYNQVHHKVLDRYSIKKTLEYLINCDVERVQGKDRDRTEQYKYLLDAYDKNSELEYKLIKHLYENEYALPDKAQVNMEDYYVSADFVYKTKNGPVLIFVDGSVHDNERVQKEDKRKREALLNAGYDIIEWHYLEPLQELLTRRKDIFRKVK